MLIAASWLRSKFHSLDVDVPFTFTMCIVYKENRTFFLLPFFDLLKAINPIVCHFLRNTFDQVFVSNSP